MSEPKHESKKSDAATPLETLAINTIRTLAMDAVEKAGSGHPGTAMALAPVAYSLWMRSMKYNPRDPRWFDRDRFVLSAGHASILQYAMLHLTGFDLSMEELQRFRQSGSLTPGHPENFVTSGVETTTGPLGQGVANSVGLAMAEAHLAAKFNRPGHNIIDHFTYVICSDGDLMEGISYEAASLAGHLGLGKLIWLYDDNKITIDGNTDLVFSENVQNRFEALGWHVLSVADANDISAVDESVAMARAETGQPSLIIVESRIGYGSPNKQDTPDAHGAPLGKEEVRLTKEAYGWPIEPDFWVPDEVRGHMNGQVERGEALQAAWRENFTSYQTDHPDLAAELERRIQGELPNDWDTDLPQFTADDNPIATRAASGHVLQALASNIPELLGGSADLSGSNNTLIDAPNFSRKCPEGRNVRWGIREHAMASISNGLALHGAVRPYVATFFIFTDYARPAIRLAALMGVPSIYVLTHDSIGLGADGPTHQPVEHLASFRAMPGVVVVRPADANEVAQAWRFAIERRDGPTLIVLTRQKVPHFVRSNGTPERELNCGAYVLSPESGETLHLVLLASGSEVQLACAAQTELATHGVEARVVSFPSWELFRQQTSEYQNSVLPADIPRIAVEAGASFGWAEWVGSRGTVLGVDKFGQSGSHSDNFVDYGLTTEEIVARSLKVLGQETPS